MWSAYCSSLAACSGYWSWLTFAFMSSDTTAVSESCLTLSFVSLLCLIVYVPQLSPTCVGNVRSTSTESSFWQKVACMHISFIRVHVCGMCVVVSCNLYMDWCPHTGHVSLMHHLSSQIPRITSFQRLEFTILLWLMFHLCCQLATPTGSTRQLAGWLWGKVGPACEDPGQSHEHHEAAGRSEGT